MKVNYISEINSEMQGLSQEALVIFDVDQVLIDPLDAILTGAGDTLRVDLLKDLGQRLGIERAHELYSIIFTHRKLRLVEDGWPAFITNLIAKGLKVIALTRFPTGKFGCISNMETWRETELFNLGIDFRSSFKDLSRICLRGSQVAGHAGTALFQSGILYTGGGGLYPQSVNKAETLAAFLRHIAWRPEQINFVDDLEHHLAALGAFCEAEKIPYQGFHYLAARKAHYPIDVALARFQFRHLEENAVWLSDIEARKHFS